MRTGRLAAASGGTIGSVDCGAEMRSSIAIGLGALFWVSAATAQAKMNPTLEQIVTAHDLPFPVEVLAHILGHPLLSAEPLTVLMNVAHRHPRNRNEPARASSLPGCLGRFG